MHYHKQVQTDSLFMHFRYQFACILLLCLTCRMLFFFWCSVCFELFQKATLPVNSISSPATLCSEPGLQTPSMARVTLCCMSMYRVILARACLGCPFHRSTIPFHCSIPPNQDTLHVHDAQNLRCTTQYLIQHSPSFWHPSP